MPETRRQKPLGFVFERTTPEASLTNRRPKDAVMIMVAHLGSCGKEYLEKVGQFRPAKCPVCEWLKVYRHSKYHRWADSSEPIPIFRFRCSRIECRKVFSVIPDFLTPGQSYPTATEEAVVAEYSSGNGTYSEISARFGVSITTCFRWVKRACAKVADWFSLAQRTVLQIAPESEIGVNVSEEQRHLWRRRRIRTAWKIERLLLLGAWPSWIRRVCQILREKVKLPDLWGLALWRWMEPRLEAFSTTVDGKSFASGPC
jgi:transposase-like protein